MIDVDELTRTLLPHDAERARLVGRVSVPGLGPSVVLVDGDEVVELTGRGLPTVAALLAQPDPVAACRPGPDATRWSLAEVVAATVAEDRERPRLLAPIDLQVVKACGVTFVESLLERVIEERAAGDPERAAELRERIGTAIGGSLRSIVPGSDQAQEVARMLKAEGMWSQYLEVGIGADPEVFTKAPVLSSVGCGVDIGVRPDSHWNNPEPELVLLVGPDGRIRGATLGNDVNLRDFEGRSALLLGEAKDNNASSALGPFVRLLDQDYGLDDLRSTQIDLRVTGSDGFVLEGSNSLEQISRDLLDLVGHVTAHHQYPDGFALFTGTLFAPIQDRERPGGGFTHHRDDVVRIHNDRLGTLVNRVRSTDEVAPWEFGISALMENLAVRGLLG